MRYVIGLWLIILAISNSPLAFANETDFDQWLIDLRKEAKALGISDNILGAALGKAKPIKRVIELDRRQPEFTMTFEEYLGKIASATRARVAAKKLIEHDYYYPLFLHRLLYSLEHVASTFLQTNNLFLFQ